MNIELTRPPELLAPLRKSWIDLKAAGALEWIVRAWASAANAAYSEREELVRVTCAFLFGQQGALNLDGGALHIVIPVSNPRLLVSEGRTESARLMTAQNQGSLVLPLFSDACDVSAVPVDVELGQRVQRLFELSMACSDRCLQAYCVFPFSFELACQLEELSLWGLAQAERGWGNNLLGIVSQLLPCTFRVLSPLVHADAVHDSQCVRLRVALNYSTLAAQYASVAEYVQRIRYCLIALYDESRTRVAATFEIRDDILEVSAHVQDGKWAYRVRGLANSDNITKQPPDENFVPLFLTGSGSMNIHVEQCQLQIKELGCASISIPQVWVELAHHNLSHGTVSPELSEQMDGHEWVWRITHISNNSRAINALLRPFINMVAYHESLCASTHVKARLDSTENNLRWRVTFPLPRISKVLCRFLNWWWVRQLSALDELRLIVAICEAVATDCAVSSDPQLSQSDGSFCTVFTAYEDARSGWLEDYDIALERRWCCWCRRRRRQNLL